MLDAEDVEYAIKVPFWQWLGLKDRIAEFRYWERVDATGSASSSGCRCRPGRGKCASWSIASACITGPRRTISSISSIPTTATSSTRPSSPTRR